MSVSEVERGAHPVGTALTRRRPTSDALRLASCFARALESYLTMQGGAASRAQIVDIVRTWVPRWDAEVPPLLADALIEVLVRQGKVVATRHYVGIADTVERWRTRFTRYPQRLTQPVEKVALECDLPVTAVVALRALAKPDG
jgi:hypothetical protein